MAYDPKLFAAYNRGVLLARKAYEQTILNLTYGQAPKPKPTHCQSGQHLKLGKGRCKPCRLNAQRRRERARNEQRKQQR